MNRLIVLIVVVLCLGVGFLFFHGPKDPLYQGKPLSLWLKEAQAASHREEPAALAVRHYGKEAEGMLNSLLAARDTSIGLKVQQLLAKQKLIKFHFQPAGELNWRGLHGCGLLGAKVPGTVPAVMDLVDRPAPPVFYRAGGYEVPLYTLAEMGPKGIEALVHELENKNPSIRLCAAELLGTAPGANTPEVIAALQKCAGDPDLRLQSVAAQSLALNQGIRNQNIPASATNWDEASVATDLSQGNLWDANKGLNLLATSGAQQGLGPSSVDDLFGGRSTRLATGETGCTILDNRKDGFVHFVEWATPQPVTVGSFGFIAMHDSAEAKFQRALRSFRLYARTGSKDEYKLVYSEELTVPYGAGEESYMLFMFRNLVEPVKASQFRAEFVQHGNGPYNGPRVTQLYAFTPKLNWPMVETALQSQPQAFQEEARLFLGR